MTDYNKAAFDKLAGAKFQLLRLYPFYGSIALSVEFIEVKSLNPPTMATDMHNIYYHPQFVAECSKHELMAVIAHEILHIAFLHGTRRGEREPKIWNFACDFAINPILIDGGMKLPGMALYDEKYLNWTAQRIYEDLLKRQDVINKLLDKLPSFKMDGEENEGGGKDVIHGGVIDLKDFKDAEGNQISQAEIENAIKMKVAGAAQTAKAIGKLPGGLEGLIKAVGKPTVNWHDYIQNWVKGHAPDDYTWTRPNRKMLANHRVYMPTILLKGSGVGVLSIDTSGSVSDAELVKYVTEIVGVIEMTKPEKLIIIQHDAVIQSITEWDITDDFSSLKTKGRGGTCVAPVFRHIDQIDDEVNWMIVFSDMEINDWPVERNLPVYPILLAGTGNAVPPPYMGNFIPLKDAFD